MTAVGGEQPPDVYQAEGGRNFAGGGPEMMGETLTGAPQEAVAPHMLEGDPNQAGFATPGPIAMVDLNTGKILAIAGEAGKERIDVTPMGPNMGQPDLGTMGQNGLPPIDGAPQMPMMATGGTGTAGYGYQFQPGYALADSLGMIWTDREGESSPAFDDGRRYDSSGQEIGEVNRSPGVATPETATGVPGQMQHERAGRGGGGGGNTPFQMAAAMAQQQYQRTGTWPAWWLEMQRERNRQKELAQQGSPSGTPGNHPSYSPGYVGPGNVSHPVGLSTGGTLYAGGAPLPTMMADGGSAVAGAAPPTQMTQPAPTATPNPAPTDPRLAMPQLQYQPAKVLTQAGQQPSCMISADQVLAASLLQERAKLEMGGVSTLLASELVRNKLATPEGKEEMLRNSPLFNAMPQVA